MDSSNEFNHDEINNSKDGRIQVNETFKYSLITDSGDVIDCSNNNDENRQSINQFDDNDRTCPIPENSIKINEYQYFNLHNFINEEKDNEQNIVLPENIDLQDLNPCEPSPSELSLYNKSQESILSPMYQLSLVDFESSSTSTSLILPQFAHKSSNSFQQLWSPRVYSPKLIDSNISKSAFFGMNAYFFIDCLLIFLCIISIFLATYEKWLFRYINSNEYDNRLNNTESDNRYWRQIKLAAYGLAIGTILNLLM